LPVGADHLTLLEASKTPKAETRRIHFQAKGLSRRGAWVSGKIPAGAAVVTVMVVDACPATRVTSSSRRAQAAWVGAPAQVRATVSSKIPPWAVTVRVY
jgi:hypothetical protein